MMSLATLTLADFDKRIGSMFELELDTGVIQLELTDADALA